MYSIYEDETDYQLIYCLYFPPSVVELLTLASHSCRSKLQNHNDHSDADQEIINYLLIN